jgi:glycosyltransferase involved in cell wall biosynthesis
MSGADRIVVAKVAAADVSFKSLLAAQVEALTAAGYDVRCVCTPGAAGEWLRERGFQMVDVSIPRRISPLADLVAVWRMARYFRRERVTVVHTHTPKPGLIGQLAAWLAGVPVILNTWHGFYFHEHTPRLKRAIFIAMEKVAARFSSMILSQNPEDIESAIRLGIAGRDRVRFLGNGVDLSRFDPDRFAPADRVAKRFELGVPEDAVVVTIIARQVREKGYVELFEAMRGVMGRHADVRFLIAGAAEPVKRDRIDPASMSRYGIDDGTQWLGRRDDIEALLHASDLYVLPSWREGFPRSAMEAAAMKLPIVATNIRGCRQVVGHEENGLLVPLRDAAALEQAIERLVTDAASRRRMGEAGRVKALAEFDERRVCRTVLDTVAEQLRAKGIEPPTATSMIDPVEQGVSAHPDSTSVAS